MDPTPGGDIYYIDYTMKLKYQELRYLVKVKGKQISLLWITTMPLYLAYDIA
jgi:hypothetical protein